MLPDAWLDTLPSSSTSHAHVVPPGEMSRDLLAHFLLQVAFESNRGLVVFRSAPLVSGVEILGVSQTLLNLLGYASEAAYIAAVESGTFVHADDLEVVERHLEHRSAQPYDAQLQRANGTYRRLRLHGGTLLVGSVEYRFTLIWAP